MKTATLGHRPSFGFGDRIGLATPGHVAAMQEAGAGIAPVFPQQSIREMQRTGRTPQQVMADALNGAAAAGWTGVTGADADHLKTPDDVDITCAAGFTFYTIDPSDDVDPSADDYGEAELRRRFSEIRDEAPWYSRYVGQRIRLPNDTTVELSEEACMRAAVKYGRAITRTVSLGKHIQNVCRAAGQEFEIELSVDETEQPTTLAEHYIIARECRENGLEPVSLAPRLIGDFEKGVDFRGDLAALETSLENHAAVADLLGGYKLSLHSGSDKLSMYAILARTTSGRFHVKTAGTSYLEALRVVAHHEEHLFRRVIDFARGRYEVDRATYHVSASLEDAPEPEDTALRVLTEQYLECWDDVPRGRGFSRPGRQILHCTFGSVLTDGELGPALRAVLEAHPDTYTRVLAEHFERHLQALQSGLETAS